MGINATVKIIIGWVLVIAGLLIIGQTISNSYQYFTAKADFPAVFTAPVANSATDSKTIAAAASQNPQEMAQAQIQQSMNQAVGNLLPVDSITKLLNTIVWSIFATILIYAAGKICSIGIQLLSSKG